MIFQEKGFSLLMEVFQHKENCCLVEIFRDERNCFLMETFRDKWNSFMVEIFRDKGNSFLVELFHDRESSFLVELFHDRGNSFLVELFHDRGYSFLVELFHDRGNSFLVELFHDREFLPDGIIPWQRELLPVFQDKRNSFLLMGNILVEIFFSQNWNIMHLTEHVKMNACYSRTQIISQSPLVCMPCPLKYVTLGDCRLVMIGHEYLWQAVYSNSNNFYYDHFKSYKTHNSYTKLQLLQTW